MKKKNKKKIRISGGIFKGRYLFLRNDHNIRPTSSRTKITVFQWLEKYLINSNCLDCFCGSGNLSIEAISRKANSVIALEKDKNTVKNLRKTLKIFNIKKIKIINTNTLTWLKKKEKNLI